MIKRYAPFAAVFAAGALVAWLAMGRYQVTPVDGEGFAASYVVDKLTGNVKFCRRAQCTRTNGGGF